ncbi:class I tRNA ligase family protein [Nostoc sp. FACHB-190]|uniref:class I tRNA ligase family protein n=1 Tax=Nostoc sp. FACHB-190 TaxID=2692838 RepID=UPI0019B1EBB2|nr:class I tRNA ligase family protein [Nostoc sp. FACHB-190]MBD2303676.1 class I tRNA ligase family protein [Nostoc sp. FACHB-190]
MTPTPDAPLHLGHMCGPYLSADALARIHRVLGRSCIFISAIDAFENWCEQIAPEKLQQLYLQHQQAFNMLYINFDNFYNPLAGSFKQVYQLSLRESFQNFKKLSGFLEKEEFIQFNRFTNLWGFGSQVVGQCPNCGEAVRGNTCIRCYFYLQPQELINSKLINSIKQKDIASVSVTNAFIQLSESCLNSLKNIHVNIQALDLLTSWLEKTQGLMRLTYQGDFGVTVSSSDLRIIRNTFIQFCYAIVQEFLKNVELKPQSVDLHLFMGFDNFIPSGAGSFILAKALGDVYIKRIELNHMLHYKGAKFSKSKQHGPTVLEALNEKDWKLRSAMRVYLMQMDLEKNNANFDPKDFSEFALQYSKLVDAIQLHAPLTNPNITRLSKTTFYNNFLNTIDGAMNRPKLAKAYIHSLELVSSTPTQSNIDEFKLACEVFDPELYSRLFVQ